MSTVIEVSSLGSDGFAIHGDAPSDRAGREVSSAGDINGDGYDDFIVGAPNGDDGGSFAGEAYVIFGKASGFGTIDLANLAPADGFIIQGDVAADYAGASVSSAGDVNGDGFDDLIVGAFGNDGGGPDAGAAYVVFGKASGFGTVDGTGRRVLDLAALAPADGFAIRGGGMVGFAGHAVSSAGDVNGDGFDDMLVAAIRDGDGAAFVLFGKAGGFGTIDLANLAPADGFLIQGGGTSDYLGLSISNAGDVNGDGFDDLILGNALGGAAGEVHVVFGKASGFGTIDLANLLPADGFVIHGDAPGDYAGFTVSSAGDVNGDGFADLVVGALGSDAGGGDAGAAYLIFGKEDGFGTIELGALGAGEGFAILGGFPDDDASRSISAAGDVNNDGYGDIIIGAPGADGAGGDAGDAYVIFGKADGFGTVDLANLSAAQGFIIRGATASDGLGRGVSAAGDVNGDGFDDLLVGAPYGSAGGAGAGEAYIIFGRIFPTDEESPAVANDDAESVDENERIIGASLFGNDTDPDGPPLQVGAVNGSSANVGSEILLASGARLTVNADGTWDYDPDGRFDTLTSTASGQVGAVNTSALDTFTYTLVDGNTATVTITIVGVVSPEDRLEGDGGNNVITGTPFVDVFMLQQGGEDDVQGRAGNDGFYFGAELSAGDVINGEGGSNDQLILQGDYSAPFTFGAAHMVNVEVLAILRGSDSRFGDTAGNLYDYDLRTVDTNVAAGQRLIVDYSGLEAGEDVTFDGSAETNGAFSFYAGKGDDHLIGGAGADLFLFRSDRFTAADRVDGRGGNDELALRGNYVGPNAVTFLDTTMTNVEVLVILSGRNTSFGRIEGDFDYDIATHDSNVAAGQRLTVDAAQLTADENLVFDGSAETDGFFRIFGGKGFDEITGGAGSDSITGGGDHDLIEGGAGADTFLYRAVLDSAPGSHDTIMDFTIGDRIDLSRIDARIGGGSNDAFTFIGSGAFTGTQGELRWEHGFGPIWHVEGDVDGDGAADLEMLVLIPDADPITASDFVL